MSTAAAHRATVPGHDALIPLTTESFDREILDGGAPALVDFTAPGCQPCRAIAPVVEALARDYQGRVKVGLLDIDAHPRIAQRFGVRAVPTLLLFQGGRVVRQLVGSGSRARIEEAVRALL